MQSCSRSQGVRAAASPALRAEFSGENYTCLVNRGRARGGAYERKDCFDLAGKEQPRWLRLTDNGGPEFSIDGVLASRPLGTVLDGLDIGSGTGTFAARMRERNVTVVTTTLDLDAPFSRFLASRGLVPLHLMQRLPFADGVLDIVHSMQLTSSATGSPATCWSSRSLTSTGCSPPAASSGSTTSSASDRRPQLNGT
ncbi:hypothetical protein ABZP36_004108 [Zizania latifolia]